MPGSEELPVDVIDTPLAPKAIGPYSQAIAARGFVFCSGQIALDPATGQLVGTTVAEQTRQVLSNLTAVLEAAGTGIGNVVKTTVYLASMADFAEMNGVYEEMVPGRPARATVAAAGLPKGALVEIDAIALGAVAPGAGAP